MLKFDFIIGKTIPSILGVMEFTKKENLPGLLIFIDFQNVLHSVYLIIGN